MSRSIVLKEIVFTEKLTDALQGYLEPECRCYEGGEAVYVFNGCILVKLDLGEYDKFVRQLTRRDAGSFIVNASTAPRRDLREIFEAHTSDPGEDLIAIPCGFDLGGGRLVSAYYSPSGDFVVCLNTKFTLAVASPGLILKAKDARSCVVCYRHTASASKRTLEPVAVIAPVIMPEDSEPVRATRKAFKWLYAWRKAALFNGGEEATGA